MHTVQYYERERDLKRIELHIESKINSPNVKKQNDPFIQSVTRCVVFHNKVRYDAWYLLFR